MYSQFNQFEELCFYENSIDCTKKKVYYRVTIPSTTKTILTEFPSFYDWFSQN